MKTFQTNKTLLALAFMSTSAFDVSSLLAAEINTEEFDIERTLIPEGDWMFRIGKPKTNSGEKDGKNWVQVILPLECIDQEVLTELGVEKIGTRIQFFLDLDENNMLAKGPNMNIDLGRAFNAAGLRGGEASILNLEGRQVRAQVKQKRADSGAEYNVAVALAPVDEE